MWGPLILAAALRTALCSLSLPPPRTNLRAPPPQNTLVCTSSLPGSGRWRAPLRAVRPAGVAGSAGRAFSLSRKEPGRQTSHPPPRHMPTGPSQSRGKEAPPSPPSHSPSLEVETLPGDRGPGTAGSTGGSRARPCTRQDPAWPSCWSVWGLRGGPAAGSDQQTAPGMTQGSRATLCRSEVLSA